MPPVVTLITVKVKSAGETFVFGERTTCIIEEAKSHPARGQLTRFVGMDSPALPETRGIELRPLDRLLLCSDGLTSMLSDEEILAILRESDGLAATCQRLVDMANEAGGVDNIAVLALSVTSDE